eukprot:1061687-Amphidinium_carterae.1
MMSLLHLKEIIEHVTADEPNHVAVKLSYFPWSRNRVLKTSQSNGNFRNPPRKPKLEAENLYAERRALVTGSLTVAFEMKDVDKFWEHPRRCAESAL